MSGLETRRQARRPIDDDPAPEVKFGLIVIFGFFALFLGWAALAPLDAAIVAPGIVTVAGDRQTVQHRDGGIVSRIVAAEGQKVRQGDILIELGAPEIVAQEQALVSQIVDLQMESARFDAESRGSVELLKPAEWAAWPPADAAIAEAAFARHRSERGQSERGASGLRGPPVKFLEPVSTEFGARIRGHHDEIAATRTQEKLLAEELKGMRALAAEQLVPLPRIRALQRSLAELQGRHAQLLASIAQTQEERSNQRRKTQAQIAALYPQLVAARAHLERTFIRAPVSGTIIGLNAHTIGGVLGPGERVMDIVPDGRELLIEAQVQPEDSNELSVGMQTEVTITAFKSRNLPVLHGILEQISADRLVDDRTGRPYFSALISIPAEELRLLTRRARLSPGLPAQVVVPTRKRTALQYFLEPLNQTLWRSFRED